MHCWTLLVKLESLQKQPASELSLQLVCLIHVWMQLGSKLGAGAACAGLAGADDGGELDDVANQLERLSCQSISKISY